MAYTIVDYRPSWPTEFAEIGSRLRRALGDLALRIDHIGSTAVPGLAAKDIIDVQVTVREFVPEIEVALRDAGFTRLKQITNDHIPPGASDDAEEWAKWFFRNPAAERPVNLHVRREGKANQRYPLLFRDYLRAHPAAAAAYARVKQALIAHRMDDPDAYYDVKDPVCDIIAGAAEGWAKAVGWQPGTSDA